MTILQAIILGIVQGVTEFLPISSSGHLVIVPYIFNWDLMSQEAFLFDVIVQLGTLVAVIMYFYRDLVSIAKAWFGGIVQRKLFDDTQARMGWYLLLATLPAAFLGLVFKDQIEQTFANLTTTAWLLLGTAGLLLVAELVGKRIRPIENINWRDALWVGTFQAIALLPGISRSGAAITGGLTRDFERPVAARFTFLMAVPVMFAAGIIAVIDLFSLPGWHSLVPTMLTGFITSAVVGYYSIRWLLRFLTRNSLFPFVIYLILLAATILLVY